MNEKDYHAIRDFCREFAHSFISCMWYEKEFSKLTGKDMKEIGTKLENYMDIDLVEFLKKREGEET